MIWALLLQASVSLLGALPPQALPERGCAAYLWSVADRRFVAVAGADPASLRLLLDGKVADMTRTGESGAGDFGFAGSIAYALGEVTASLDMTIARRGDLTAGAAVPAGVLTITRTGGDAEVVPIAGMIGCR